MPVTDVNTAAVAGIYTEQIMSMHDVFKPQHIPELFSRYGAQYMPMFQIFRGLSRETPIANDEWFAHEENWYHRTITTLGATTQTGAGSPVDITLAVADHDSNGNSYPRVGDIITIQNATFDQALITDKDETNAAAHVLTLTPANSAVNLPVIADGATLSITNGAFGAGTDQPRGTVVGTTKRTFYAQIFKETIGAEGSQLVNEKWYKVMDSGKSVKGWYSPGYMRGEYLMALKMDGAFTWGDDANDNLTVPAGEEGAGNAIKLTKGLMRHVTDRGRTLNYTAGAFDPTDLDQVGLYLKSQGVTTGYTFNWYGAHLMNDWENGMVDYLATNSGGTDYTNVVKNVFKGNEDLSVAVGFQVLKKGGITHIVKPMDAWSNPKTFGAEGYDLTKYGLITPLSKFVDPKSGGVLNNIGTRYRAMDGYSRRFETWSMRGAGNGQKVISIDKTNTFFRSHVGLQALKVNQMIKLIPA